MQKNMWALNVPPIAVFNHECLLVKIESLPPKNKNVAKNVAKTIKKCFLCGAYEPRREKFIFLFETPVEFSFLLVQKLGYIRKQMKEQIQENKAFIQSYFSFHLKISKSVIV